jgi:hypothetical protein
MPTKGHRRTRKAQPHGRKLLTVNSTTPVDWSGLLTAFTRRNADRRTVLEVDDAAIGAQQAEEGLRLRGIAYDPRDRRVEIMLGQLTGTRHMTHTIVEPDEIGIVSATKGHDLAIRIGHAGSATILTFPP